MKIFRRYDRPLIILIIAVISVAGVALINSPNKEDGYWKKSMPAGFEEMVEHTLNINFENSLIAVDLNKDRTSFAFEIDKSYTIKNRSVDEGHVYHLKSRKGIDSDKLLREMIDVLSDNYKRIRRGTIIEGKNGSLISIEENGVVYDEMDTYTYINKLIMTDREIWLFVLTFNQREEGRIREFLDAVSLDKEKGVKIG